jgi:HSP20 family molecular chaperone IbpA
MRMPVRREVQRADHTDWSKVLMKTDILEVGDNYQLEVELPGFSKEEVKLHLKDGNLTIEAFKENSEEKAEEGKFLRRERFTGSCQRTFFVGKDLRHEDIKAKYDKGILTITFPKEVKREVEEKKYISIEG